jgi:hypothetical protein
VSTQHTDMELKFGCKIVGVFFRTVFLGCRLS